MPLPDLPLACVPGGIPAAERAAHFDLIERLFRQPGVKRIPARDGYEYRFPASSFGAVARFIEHERLCCPFVTFRLTLEANAEVIHLELTGPPGTREFLDAELPPVGTG